MKIKMLLGLIMALAFSSEILATKFVYPPASLSSPRDTMNYFLKTMKGSKNGDSTAIELAIEALDLTKLDVASRTESGKLAAQRLINTLDRIELIDVEKIPNREKGAVWFYRKQEVTINQVDYPVEIAIGAGKDGKWRFTSNTVETIENYERSLLDTKVAEGVTQLITWKDKLKGYMPAWTGNKILILKNGQWIGLFFVILLGFIFERIVNLYVKSFLIKAMKKKNIIFPEELRKKLVLPIALVSFSFTWLIGVRLLELNDNVLSWMLRIGDIIMTIGFVLTAHHVVDVVSLFFEEIAQKTENSVDDLLIPLLRKTAKTFIAIVGFIAIGDSLTIDMKGLVAGLGIGGLAFAFASKDALANLFGSVTVLLDRPFRIGDAVVIGGNIEGSVEEVGLRSTRIRTYYDSVITVPNGNLTNAHIDNYGQRRYRRFTTTLGLEYGTPPEKIEAFCEGVRQLILNHKYTRKDSFHVYFSGFGASSLDIMLYMFFNVPDIASERAEKHRLLMDIYRLGHELGVEFAFPTQTLHVFNEAKAATTNLDAGPYDKGKEVAEQLCASSFVQEGPRSSIDHYKL